MDQSDRGSCPGGSYVVFETPYCTVGAGFSDPWRAHGEARRIHEQLYEEEQWKRRVTRGHEDDEN